jgi:hypothetical protein
MRGLIAWVFMYSLNGPLADEGTEYWHCRFGLPNDPRTWEQLGSSDDANKADDLAAGQGEGARGRGEHPDAERLALEAVAICEETERLDAQGGVYADVAEVLVLAGRSEGAAEALE